LATIALAPRWASCVAAFAALTLTAAAAVAQSYPSKPIRMIVGYGPAGGADSFIRTLAPELSELLRQPVVIENRPGAGTIIATQLVAESKPDGYTFYVADFAFLVNPALKSRLPYDSLRDFAPVVLATSGLGSLLVVHPSLPVKSVKELLALARAHPGKINYATGGNGTSPHLIAEQLKFVTKTNLVHIPYKSTAQAILAVTGGEVGVAFGGIFAVKPLADAGRLRALAIASAERTPMMPDVPTFAETGWPNVEATSYRGLLAPAGTPREIIVRVNETANKVLQMPAVRARLVELGFPPLGGSPEDFGRLIRAEIDKWRKVVRDAGISVE
jgi:tripartite-type tricarboxylate transporter receptor subunit TctC